MSRIPTVVSHRGLGFGHPENTLAGFVAASDHGSTGVELDVRITRDAVAVVCHDADLVLPDGTRLEIDQVDADLLAGAIPMLEEALGALGALLVDLEIKTTDAPIEPVLEAIGGTRVRLSSFSVPVLEQARAKAPDVPRALLLEPGLDLPRSTAEALLVGAEGVHVHRSMLSPAYVQSWRAAGLSVRAYTLNDQEAWAHAANLGVDAIITDRPLALEAWLAGSTA